MGEETYVVRIYRRARVADPIPRKGLDRRRYDQIALSGVIEDVEQGERRSFHDIGELWAILSDTARTDPNR